MPPIELTLTLKNTPLTHCQFWFRPRDEGVYECQINTEPKIHHKAYLVVQGNFVLFLFTITIGFYRLH